MVDAVPCHHTLVLIIIVPARIQVSGKTGEVTAAYLYTDTVTFFEKVAGGHWGKLQGVYFSVLHKDLFVVALPITCPLNGLIQIIGPTIRIHINEFDRKIGVFGI